MPGIAGLVGDRDAGRGRSLVGSMLAALGTKQPSADVPMLVDSDVPAVAGFAGTTVCGGLAVAPSGDLGLVYSGEVFAPGPGEGVQVGNGGDGWAWMLNMYRKHGIECLAMLNGCYSGLLVDLRQHQAILFNDRFGLGRVYCHETAAGLAFASEAKSLIEAFPPTRGLDERALGEWLSCGCALQDRSLFANISLLPPGSAWVFSPGGKVVKRRYFEGAAWEAQPPLPAQDFYARLRETFPRVLKRYFSGPEKLGMSLTGGLDGRMIMSWLPCGEGQLPCYTFNGPVRDCADATIARRVARACRQPHQTIAIADQFFDEFAALARDTIVATDGAMDVTGAVELYANRLAREIAPVRLTGNYGSEILRRNVAFRPRRLRGGVLHSGMVLRCEEAAQTYAREANGNRLSFIAFKQVPWHHFGRFAAERSQIQVRSPYLDNELVALAYQAPPEAASSVEPALRLIAEGNPVLGRIPTDRGLTYPAEGAANRAKRVFQEFLAKAEYAFDYGMPTWLAQVDRCLAPLRLERWFLGRQKFCHYRSWYRGKLARCVQEVLLDPSLRQRSYLHAAAVEPMVKAHLNGQDNFTLEIHKLMSLELIQRHLIKRS